MNLLHMCGWVSFGPVASGQTEEEPIIQLHVFSHSLERLKKLHFPQHQLVFIKIESVGPDIQSHTGSTGIDWCSSPEIHWFNNAITVQWHVQNGTLLPAVRLHDFSFQHPSTQGVLLQKKGFNFKLRQTVLANLHKPN